MHETRMNGKVINELYLLLSIGPTLKIGTNKTKYKTTTHNQSITHPLIMN